MPSAENFAHDDELLTRYLLGELSAEQAEKLDELSVVDDEFALRLSSIENDLVDGFVRGELPEDVLKKFRSFYLSSAKRQEKVEFAAGLLALKKSAEEHVQEPTLRTAGRSWWGWVSPFRQWSFAAAALALLVVAGYLFTDNLSLRQQAKEAGLDRQNEQQRQKEPDQQHAAATQVQSEADRPRETTTVPGQFTTVALLLPAPTRGPGHIENVSIRTGTDFLVLALILEADDFPQYRISLQDPATQQQVWQSPNLSSATSSEHKTVTVSVPAKLLKQQRFLAQLKGIQRGGTAKPIADYPFSVVLR